MKYDDAYAEAVTGAWITADHLQPGSYLSYAFAGLRINFGGGSSSGYSPRPEDREADWRICGPETSKPDVLAGFSTPVIKNPPKWGTADGKPWPKPDRGEERSWGEVFADKQATEGGWRDTPKPTRDKWGKPV